MRSAIVAAAVVVEMTREASSSQIQDQALNHNVPSGFLMISHYRHAAGKI